jgi:hypothetical protein
MTILTLAVLGLRAGRALSGQDAGFAVPEQAPTTPAAKSPVLAKPAPKEPGRAHAFELSVSVVVLGPSSLGSSSATLTPNQTGSAPPYTFFATSGQLQTAPGADVRVGYTVTREVAVEGGMTYSRPGVSLNVSQDAENAAGFSETAEHLSQYSFDAAVRVHIKPLEFRRGRGRPFVAASVAYLRQLHEGHTVADTGTLYSFGGGTTYLLQARRVRLLPGLVMQGLGIRADVRANVATDGFTFDGRHRLYAGASGGLSIGF